MHRILVPALAAVLAIVAPLKSASASALWFVKAAVHANHESTCLHFAHSTALELGYQDVQVSDVDVHGFRNGVLIAITCVDRSLAQETIAIVMATHEFDGELARDEAQAAAADIQRYICIDSIC